MISTGPSAESPPYQILATPRGQRAVDRCPAIVKESAKTLAQDPRRTGALKMVGGDEWLLRIGDYRIIYLIDDSTHTVTVLFAGHRRDVYLEWDR